MNEKKKTHLKLITIISCIIILGLEIFLGAFDIFADKVANVAAEPVVETQTPENVSAAPPTEPPVTTPAPAPEKKKIKKIKYKKGWTNECVNIRKKPTTKSKVLTTLDFNTKIKYIKYNKKWVQVKYNKKIGYIVKKYISKKKKDYKQYSVPKSSGFKSYMGYKAITNRRSRQYQLQVKYAYTGNYGIRQVKDRYCVAIGSYFGVKIGQYFDLVLKNGTIIPCIAGDAKANKDTDGSNIFSRNGCCSEFVVDSGSLVSSIRRSGNVSSACKEWNSPVSAIRVYKINIFD